MVAKKIHSDMGKIKKLDDFIIEKYGLSVDAFLDGICPNGEGAFV